MLIPQRSEVAAGLIPNKDEEPAPKSELPSRFFHVFSHASVASVIINM